MKVLLDTNVISETGRAECNPAVRAHLQAMDDSDLHISVITIGELANGIARLKPGRKRTALQEWLAETELLFADRLLPVSLEIARLWGNLTAKAAAAGRPLPATDGLIAATALHHGLHLLTRNVTDFDATGVVLINPWEIP